MIFWFKNGRERFRDTRKFICVYTMCMYVCMYVWVGVGVWSLGCGKAENHNAVPKG